MHSKCNAFEDHMESAAGSECSGMSYNRCPLMYPFVTTVTWVALITIWLLDVIQGADCYLFLEWNRVSNCFCLSPIVSTYLVHFGQVGVFAPGPFH